MFTTLIVIHVIISLILIVTVLMQHGKQQCITLSRESFISVRQECDFVYVWIK